MRFGITYVSYIYSEERISLCNKSLVSLAKTDISKLSYKPIFTLSWKQGIQCDFRYEDYFDILKEKFDVISLHDPSDWSVYYIVWQNVLLRMFDEHPDVTHVIPLYDDWIFNPEWLNQLMLLIKRRSDGIAWSVHKSMTTEIISGSGSDVLMNMHSGIGCVTREEWDAYKQTPGWNAGQPDTGHCIHRKGNRWATGVDYIEDMGHIPGAFNFVGEE